MAGRRFSTELLKSCYRKCAPQMCTKNENCTKHCQVSKSNN